MPLSRENTSTGVPLPGRFQPRSLAEEAYCHIERMILSGKLKSGDKISEKDIAAGLGVSRTPIREALKMLEQYGVVEFKPRSYAKVASITREETIKLAEVRVEIEKLAARTLLADRGLFHPEALLAKVERSLQSLDEDNLADAYLFDSAFHLEWARQSDNAILYDVVQRLDAKSQLVRIHSRTLKECYREQLREHIDMVRLLDKGAKKELMDLITKHITPRFWAARGFDTSDK